jgi:excisionase family DNA binding protein
MAELMTVQEAAGFLKVSTSFVYRETAGGRLRHYKVGASNRYSEEQLREWLVEREVKPIGDKGKALSLES